MSSDATPPADASRWAFLRNFNKTDRPRASIPERITFAHSSPITAPIALDYIPCSDRSISRPDQVLVFILGNPGILEYYHPFLLHLSTLLPRTAIISTSHIGHTPDLSAPPEPLTLAEQLEGKVELVGSLRRALDSWSEDDAADDDAGDGGDDGDEEWVDASVDPSQAKTSPRAKTGVVEKRIGLVLMGHSIGAWMAVEAAKRLGEGADAVMMLFPTVGWIADSPNGRRLWPIFRPPLIHLLPLLASLLLPLLLLLTSLPSLAALLHLPPPTLSLLRSPRTIRHVLHLAKSEMSSVQVPDIGYFEEASALRPVASRVGGAGAERKGVQGMKEVKGAQGVYGIWSDQGVDRWVGREGGLVQRAMGGEDGGRVRIVGKIPHAFCLSIQHSKYVAEIIAGWIRGDPPTVHSSVEDEAERRVEETVASFPM